MSEFPLVLVAIHAKDAAGLLPFYLRCLEALDYPKAQIAIAIQTNNSTDDTVSILRAWACRMMIGPGRYAALDLNADDAPETVQNFGRHEWNPTRFAVLGRARQATLDLARLWGCHFYFTADCDNFVRPNTLRTLVDLNLPIVAPFLKNVEPTSLYSNYHETVDDDGYFRPSDAYLWLYNQQVHGVNEVALVHCTYLVRADALPHLRYQDDTPRHEYVIFADSARRAGIKQYLDNREVYGLITFDADSARVEAVW